MNVIERIKGSIVLGNELLLWEQQIVKSIVAELSRIGREISMDEFAYVPFSKEVELYIESIWLDEQQVPMIGCSFFDLERDSLLAFLHREEIDHYQLIDLLDLLKGIDGKNGVKASVLVAVTGELIGYWHNWDKWICLCGNDRDAHGFHCCDADGNLMEPVNGSEWKLYRCECCGRVINLQDHQVLGINLNPRREEV